MAVREDLDKRMGLSRVGESNQRAQTTLPGEVWHDDRDIIAANDCTPRISAALQCGAAVRPMDLAFVVSRLSVAVTGQEDQRIAETLVADPVTGVIDRVVRRRG